MLGLVSLLFAAALPLVAWDIRAAISKTCSRTRTLYRRSIAGPSAAAAGYQHLTRSSSSWPRGPICNPRSLI